MGDAEKGAADDLLHFRRDVRRSDEALLSHSRRGKAPEHRAVVDVEGDPAAEIRPPLAVRIINRLPFLQRLAARMIGVGVRPEHVRSPDRFGKG